MIIDGAEIAKDILSRFSGFSTERYMAVILVGDDPSSISFIRQKERVAKNLGIDFKIFRFPATYNQDQLQEEIKIISGQESCGGVIIQLPLPEHIDRQTILNILPVDKDVDVLGEKSISELDWREGKIYPPAAGVVGEIVKRINFDLSISRAAIVGTGVLVGRPVFKYLEPRVLKVASFHRSSGDVKSQLRNFNIIVSGAGQPNLFSSHNLDPGTVVIDFGYGAIEGKTVGDFDPVGANEKNILYTPTPGGTGPILVAELYKNFFILNKMI